MTTQLLPVSVRPALRELQNMLERFWAHDLPSGGIPLEFWSLENDEIFFDALQYLPCCIYTAGGTSGKGHSRDDLSALPAGFQLATTIFELEEGFDNEGWTAIPNLGEEQLKYVIQAYRTVGLPRRAAALERVLIADLASKEDHNEDDYIKAASGELPDLRDDEEALNVVFTYLRSDSETLFGRIS